MKEIKLTEEQNKAAVALNEGEVLCAYRDGNTIRMETKEGEDPFVWRNGKWRRMSPVPCSR